MSGRYEGAIDAARRLVKAMDATTLAAQYLYAFTPLVTEPRFEKWDAVLAEPSPPTTLVLDRAIALYAKGAAYAAKGDLAKAKDERDLLSAVIAVGDFSRYGESTPEFALAGVSGQKPAERRRAGRPPRPRLRAPSGIAI